MKQPIDFFTKAKDIGIRLFRSQPSCDCGACANELYLGIIPTTDDDVKRLFNEQVKGVVFTVDPPEYPAVIFKENKPNKTSKKIRAMQLTQNKKILEKLLLK